MLFIRQHNIFTLEIDLWVIHFVVNRGLIRKKSTSSNRDSANPESGDVTTSNRCISFCYLSKRPVPPPFFVLHFPLLCHVMADSSHYPSQWVPSPPRVRCWRVGTSVTVAIWHPVRGCDIYSRPLVRVTWASPLSIRPTPPLKSVLLIYVNEASVSHSK